MARCVITLLTAICVFAMTSAPPLAQVDDPGGVEPLGDVSHLAFGVLHLTVNQTARLDFVNVPGVMLPARPVRVQLAFLGGDGEILLQPVTRMVWPGQTTSLALSGDSLVPSGSSQVAVLPVVRILDNRARGFASVEIEDAMSESRFVLRAREITPLMLPPRPWGLSTCAGPIRMRAGESARLTVVNTSWSFLVMRLRITDTDNNVNLVEQTFLVDRYRSAAVDLPQHVGPIMGAVSIEDRGQGVQWPYYAVTFELFNESLMQHTARIPTDVCDSGSGYGVANNL